MKRAYFVEQIVPLILTVVVCAALIAVIWVEIHVLNRFTRTHIAIQVRWSDVLIGMTIYLKTSVDFAIFIGNLMHTARGWKNRVMIEIGTAMGNALGTIIILALWDIFRDIKPLLAVMIVWAALVLFKLAEDGFEHARDKTYTLPRGFYLLVDKTEKIVHFINRFTSPILSRVMPQLSMNPPVSLTLLGLFLFSFRVPFVLGLDDFAGYVPVFDIVNVFGFSIGVLCGHMILNILLFISPEHTIKIVKHPVISYLGSVAFVILAIWGLYEVSHVLIPRN
ncbi:MAG: hypothetical protein WCO78_04295 [Candidatus Roizmanbacteria bacterium]